MEFQNKKWEILLRKRSCGHSVCDYQQFLKMAFSEAFKMSRDKSLRLCTSLCTLLCNFFLLEVDLQKDSLLFLISPSLLFSHSSMSFFPTLCDCFTLRWKTSVFVSLSDGVCLFQSFTVSLCSLACFHQTLTESLTSGPGREMGKHTHSRT